MLAEIQFKGVIKPFREGGGEKGRGAGILGPFSTKFLLDLKTTISF